MYYVLPEDGQVGQNTVEPLITDTAGELKFCPL
jgi:hypothetical protein